MQTKEMKWETSKVNGIFSRDLLNDKDGTFKMIKLSPNSTYPIHRHPNKTEFAFVLQGTLTATIGEEEFTGEEGAFFTFPVGTMHELKNSDQDKETIILVGAIMKKHAEPSLEHENAFMNPKLIENVAPQLRPFVEDHIEICKVLDSAKSTIKKETVEAVLQVVGEEIDHHFVAEEELLFPLMGKHVGGTDVGPVARLIEEHHKIRKLYGELQETFDVFVKQDSERTRTSLDEKLKELSRTLLNHLGKEDSHLFPMASRLLTEDEKNAVAKELLQYK